MSGVVVAFALLTVMAAAAPAQAAPSLKVREVYPGATVSPLSEYVELQMTVPGQDDVEGKFVRFYDDEGVETDSFEMTADVANGASQRRVLLATTQAAGVGATEPDFTLPSDGLLDPAGGAVCFTGGEEDDCVTWGPVPLQEAPFPDPQSANAAAIPDGKALARSIAPGCSTFLDPADDSGSGQDFGEEDPSPQRNSSVPPEVACQPDTLIGTAPSNPTNKTKASFTYDELPADYLTVFECAFDWEGDLEGGDFSPCSAEGASFEGLEDGFHRFAVRAEGQGGVDASPDVHNWLVDTAPPETTIDSTPPSPNSGFSAKYTYSSSEPNSTFQCQLDGGPVLVCSAAGKSYFALDDGSHTFRVWATDNAGNKDPTPATDSFEVETVLGDETPPNTWITAAPANPSPTSTATFNFVSSEPGSTFECRLDGAPFAPCSPQGAVYLGLPNGPHGFEVRATDAAGNVDSVPASYVWHVAEPPPTIRFTSAPAGNIRGKGKKAVKATFRFNSSKPGSTFGCRLDLKGAYKPCRSPHTVRATPGRHVFEVVATDRLGNEGTPSFRIFRVQAKGQKQSFFVQSGRFLNSFSAALSTNKLPRRGTRPVSLTLGSTFENLDGSDIPSLKRIRLLVAGRGGPETKGLPRCPKSRLAARTSKAALAACRSALIGRGHVDTAIRFPGGSRQRNRATLLMFNAGRKILMHVYADKPVKTTFVVTLHIKLRKGLYGSELVAGFPRLAAGFGQVTGFEMNLKRSYRFRGKRRSYLNAGCPAPRGLKRLAFELVKVDYRFRGGLRIANSSFNTCRAIG